MAGFVMPWMLSRSTFRCLFGTYPPCCPPEREGRFAYRGMCALCFNCTTSKFYYEQLALPHGCTGVLYVALLHRSNGRERERHERTQVYRIYTRTLQLRTCTIHLGRTRNMQSAIGMDGHAIDCLTAFHMRTEAALPWKQTKQLSGVIRASAT